MAFAKKTTTEIRKKSNEPMYAHIHNYEFIAIWFDWWWWCMKKSALFDSKWFGVFNLLEINKIKFQKYFTSLGLFSSQSNECCVHSQSQLEPHFSLYLCVLVEKFSYLYKICQNHPIRICDDDISNGLELISEILQPEVGSIRIEHSISVWFTSIF